MCYSNYPFLTVWQGREVYGNHSFTIALVCMLTTHTTLADPENATMSSVDTYMSPPQLHSIEQFRHLIKAHKQGEQPSNFIHFYLKDRTNWCYRVQQYMCRWNLIHGMWVVHFLGSPVAGDLGSHELVNYFEGHVGQQRLHSKTCLRHGIWQAHSNYSYIQGFHRTLTTWAYSWKN